MTLQLGSPKALATEHALDQFACGEASLDEWLKRRAISNQLNGASRTFVVANPEKRVYGYYALSAGAVSHQIAGSALRRNMPDPIPVLILARLAVDQQAQGIKLGGALLQDAANRAIAVAQNAGVRALAVHALHEHAKRFYEHYGFQSSPLDAMVLLMRLQNR